MKHFAIKMFGRELLEFQSSVTTQNDTFTHDRINKLEERVGDFETGILRLADSVRALETTLKGMASLGQHKPEKAMPMMRGIQIAPAEERPTVARDWKALSEREAKIVMTRVYNGIAEDVAAGHKEIVLTPGADFDASKDYENTIGAIKTGLRKRGIKWESVQRVNHDEIEVRVA